MRGVREPLPGKEVLAYSSFVRGRNCLRRRRRDKCASRRRLNLIRLSQGDFVRGVPSSVVARTIGWQQRKDECRGCFFPVVKSRRVLTVHGESARWGFFIDAINELLLSNVDVHCSLDHVMDCSWKGLAILNDQEGEISEHFSTRDERAKRTVDSRGWSYSSC